MCRWRERRGKKQKPQRAGVVRVTNWSLWGESTRGEERKSDFAIFSFGPSKVLYRKIPEKEFVGLIFLKAILRSGNLAVALSVDLFPRFACDINLLFGCSLSTTANYQDSPHQTNNRFYLM